MLDCVCVMLDDQGMPEEWTVRVQGKEYGPADIETLREWKDEGRLLAENEARQSGADHWSTAAAIPGLFDATPSAVPSASQLTQPPVQDRRRSFTGILAEAVRIYGKGFFQFLCLTLLVLLPSVVSQLASGLIQRPAGSEPGVLIIAAAGFGFIMLILSLVMWPVYIAGIQILTAEIVGGRRPALIPALNEAVRFWPRIAALCIFVYGVFALLMIFGLIIAAIALAGQSSLVLIVVALGLLVLQVWAFGRFFVNVLFWQQFCVLENAGFLEALRDSRNLARSGRDLPWFQRPLWRGALIASLWFAFALVVTLVSEWPLVHHYFTQIATTQDPQTLLQQLTETQQAHGFDVLGFSLNILQRILQPLLGIAFVVLYLDSKSHVQQ
jgi:hypothetical protein